jgi:hypothetical protein
VKRLGGARAAITAAVVGVTVGCAATSPAEDFSIEPGPVGSVPVFTGPHAAEFTRLWTASKSDLEREILADEQVTDSEHQELLAWYSRCMEDQGLSVTFEGDAVSFGTDDDGRIMAAESVCLTDTMDMYRELRVNPDNLDYRVIIPECLVRHGLVDSGFGPDEYEQMWMESPDWWADLVVTDEYQACNDDPLELLGDRSADMP